jgi:hypothetical protein
MRGLSLTSRSRQKKLVEVVNVVLHALTKMSDAAGKVLMECIIETKAATVLSFFPGLRGSLWVTFEEGTSAAWLYDLLKSHVTKVVVCDPAEERAAESATRTIGWMYAN